MKHYLLLKCIHFDSDDLVKNGQSENETQRWRCKKCKRSFQLEYNYNAWRPGIKEQIFELTMNSSGVRDISRTLKINKNTVIKTLKKTPSINPYLMDMAEANKLDIMDITINYTAEMDEFWSFVETKFNQRWTWYAMDKSSGVIIAWHNGKRTDEDFQKLLGHLSHYPIDRYYTDDWGAYSRYLPAGKHIIGKDMTWKIERKNLNFRTHIKRLNRKTICYSKNEEIHDNVIGMYIARHYYRKGVYGSGVINGLNP